MRRMTKAVALLLVMMMVVALCACGGKSITGKWSYNFELKKYIDSMSDSMLTGASDEEKAAYEEIFNVFDDVSIAMIMEFKDDGTYALNVDEASVAAAEGNVKEGLKTALPNMYSAMGVNVDDYLSMVGMTLDDLIEDSIGSFGFDDFKDISNSGKYRFDGSKLYTAEDGDEIDESEYVTVELSGAVMTFTSGVGDVEGFEEFKDVLFPMTFTKIG